MAPRLHLGPALRITGSSLASLLMVVWVASAWGYVAWWNATGFALSVGHGQLVVIQVAPPDRQDCPIGTFGGWERAPFHWWFDWERDRSFRWVGIPVWTLAAAVQAVVAASGRRAARARRRRRAGQCTACGYARAGLPPGTPCPECGGARV